MTANLSAGDLFPDFELLDHRKQPRRLSSFTESSPMDEKLGFTDGYPLILTFGRGFFCPRDQQHMRQLVRFQDELAVNYRELVSQRRLWLGRPSGQRAERLFLSDEKWEVTGGEGASVHPAARSRAAISLT